MFMKFFSMLFVKKITIIICPNLIVAIILCIFLFNSNWLNMNSHITSYHCILSGWDVKINAKSTCLHQQWSELWSKWSQHKVNGLFRCVQRNYEPVTRRCDVFPIVKTHLVLHILATHWLCIVIILIVVQSIISVNQFT